MSPRNVILLTADAWRADFVDDHQGVALTPALDPWRQHTARFTRAYANAPWTTPALVSALTGLPAAAHGVHYEWSSPRPEVPSVAGWLKDRGWHCPNLSYLNNLDNYHHLGWDPAQTPARPTSPADDTLLDALARTPEPFFLWFHYKWTHLPYWASEPFRQVLGVDEGAIPEHLWRSVCTGFVVPRAEHRLHPEDAPLVRRLYAAGVLELNAFLARVMEALDAHPGRARTSLVLTSDHGEELLEHGHVGHASTAHHASLFEETLRIPLMIIDPRVDGHRQIDTRVQGLDLHRTLLSLAGAPRPDAPGLDLSLAALGQPDALEGHPRRDFAFHAARAGCPTPRSMEGHLLRGVSDGRHKLIVSDYGQRSAALYDLEADPQELHPQDPGPELDRWLQRLQRAEACD